MWIVDVDGERSEEQEDKNRKATKGSGADSGSDCQMRTHSGARIGQKPHRNNARRQRIVPNFSRLTTPTPLLC